MPPLQQIHWTSFNGITWIVTLTCMTNILLQNGSIVISLCFWIHDGSKNKLHGSGWKVQIGKQQNSLTPIQIWQKHEMNAMRCRGYPVISANKMNPVCYFLTPMDKYQSWLTLFIRGSPQIKCSSYTEEGFQLHSNVTWAHLCWTDPGSASRSITLNTAH